MFGQICQKLWQVFNLISFKSIYVNINIAQKLLHGPLSGEFTGHRWIPLAKASDAELWCFLWSAGWVNNREAGDLRRHCAYYDVIIIILNDWHTQMWEMVIMASIIDKLCQTKSELRVRWCHRMKTFSALLVSCEGNVPITGGFLSQRANNMEMFHLVLTRTFF